MTHPIVAIIRSLAVSAIALAACGPSSASELPPRATETPAPSSAPRVDPALLDQLALLTTGMPTDVAFAPGERARWQGDLTTGKATLDGYLDALLATPQFAEGVAPRVIVSDALLRRNPTATIGNPLKTTEVDGKKLYFLDKPCALAQAVTVHPWWDAGAEVLVCSDSYRPDVYRFRIRGEWAYCGAKEETGCGCGPNLIRCSSGAAQESALRDHTRQELELTVAHVVRNNLPISTLFTMNETVRSWEGELEYRRATVNSSSDGQPFLDVMARWSEPALRPRPELWPGQHAGILTAPRVIRTVVNPRQILREMEGMLWCSSVESRGASAHDVLALGGKNLQGLRPGWQELAARPVCTDCHARLDYGIQFFRGYADVRSPGAFPLAELVLPGKMQLYGRDIDDPRGEDRATPAGFARLATAQPEFASCMSQRVVGHVFGHEASPADLDEVRRAYEQSPTIKHLMKTALLDFAHQWEAARATPVRPVAAAAAVALTTPDPRRLHALVEEHCADCHDHGDKVDLMRDDLAPALVFNMITQVTYGTMPKGDNAMSLEARSELVRFALAEALPGNDPEQQKVVQSYFLDRGLPLPVHDIDDAFAFIDSAAGVVKRKPKLEWGLYEYTQDYGQMSRQWSPSFSAAVGFKALEACHASGAVAAALDACLDRALDPTMLAKSTRLP